ncbi:MAG: PqiC family protein [Zoogloeaceae bacterium]|jgi:cholesterol transport system auxiliary component|nr:PqiC family protein [Zoogloeaceae bacterium]
MLRPCARLAFCGLALLLVSGCSSLLPSPSPGTEPRHFDLGPAYPLPQTVRPWRIVTHADARLEDKAMHYRLLYDNPSEVRVYTRARWAQPPASILRQALETRLYWSADAAQDHCLLTLGLLRFEQEFTHPGQSRGVLTLRASLRNDRHISDERLFAFTVPAPSPDAAGGVAALADATEQLADALKTWRNAQRANCTQ